MPGRYTNAQGNGSTTATTPTVNDLQRGAYTQAADGQPAIVVTNPDGSSVGGGATTPGGSTTNGNVQIAVARDVTGKQTRAGGTNSNITTDLQENEWVRESYAPLAEDNVVGVIKVEQRFNYYTASAAGTFTIKSGTGYIQTLTILGGTAGAITVYDNTAGSGTAICPTFTPTSTFPAPSVDLYASFTTGLTLVLGAATVIEVSYR